MVGASLWGLGCCWGFSGEPSCALTGHFLLIELGEAALAGAGKRSDAGC